jgi:hypothetical protein
MRVPTNTHAPLTRAGSRSTTSPRAPPSAQHGDDTIQHRLRRRRIGLREQGQQQLGPAGVFGEGERAAFAATDDAALTKCTGATLCAHATGRPELARLDHHVLPAHERSRRFDALGSRPCAGRRQQAGAHAATAAVAGLGIVERFLQEAHQAPRAARERTHQAGFTLAHLRRRLPALGVVGPWLAGECLRGAVAFHHLVDGEDRSSRLG